VSLNLPSTKGKEIEKVIAVNFTDYFDQLEG
jgi:hypothetical protein